MSVGCFNSQEPNSPDGSESHPYQNSRSFLNAVDPGVAGGVYLFFM